MSYETTVWPGLLGVMEKLKGVPPLTNPVPLPDGTTWPNKGIAGYSSGEQWSVPATPWAWLINENIERSRNSGGQDLEAKTFRAVIRLMHDFTNDSKQAELMIMPLAEQVMQAFRAHIKLGFPTIAQALVDVGDWGYISVNGIWYRSLDLTVNISEKEVKPYAA